MDYKKAEEMFYFFNQKYFWGKLDKVKLNWSENMTLCTGKTYCKLYPQSHSRYCSIYLSKPILSQRSPQDTINTLLHEMIHAYLFVTGSSGDKSDHGPQFKEHMTRINKLQGSKITVFHTFHKEVDKFRVHVYHCDGPCRKKKPYFGEVRRAITRPPGPTDHWWAKHNQECGGTFHKVKGPDVTPTSGHTSESQREPPPPSARPPSPPCTPSPIGSVSSENQSSERMQSVLRNKMNKSGAIKKLDFGEKQVIQNKSKYQMQTKSTILLPNKMEKRPKSLKLERVTLVEGRVNYNYQMKSKLKFNIHKYLEQYRLVKNAEKKDHHKIDVAQNREIRMRQVFNSSSERASGSSHTTVSPVVNCWNCGVDVMAPKNIKSQTAQRETKYTIQSSSKPEMNRNEFQLRVNDMPSTSSQEKIVDGEKHLKKLVSCDCCGKKLSEEKMDHHVNSCYLSVFTNDF